MTKLTWGDFLRWVDAHRNGYAPGPTYGIRQASQFVQTEREATAALLGLGMRPDFAERLREEWLAMQVAKPLEVSSE
ncbi:hypothetical protein WMF38_57180 [Sorangium sp. So ce118]